MVMSKYVCVSGCTPSQYKIVQIDKGKNQPLRMVIIVQINMKVK